MPDMIGANISKAKVVQPACSTYCDSMIVHGQP